MEVAALRLLVIGAFILCVIGIVYAIASSTRRSSGEKGKQKLRAYVCIGAGICIGALAVILLQTRVPVLQGIGVIETAQIRSEVRGHRTNFTVRVPSGAVLALKASGSSPYFHPGEQVNVRYQGYSGSVLKVHFLSPSGREEGVFNGTDSWPPYWFVLIGLLIIWAGAKKYKRDPEGAEQASGRNPKPYGEIDKFSLLRLSGRSGKIRKS
jgi:hypothetical protein